MMLSVTIKVMFQINRQPHIISFLVIQIVKLQFSALLINGTVIVIVLLKFLLQLFHQLV